MPTMVVSTSVPANGQVNVLSGQQYEFMPFPAMLEFGIAAAAAGVVATVYSGSDLLQQEGPTVVKAANTPPVYPDDFLLNDMAAPQDRIQVSLRNTTGAAIVAITVVRINPV
jgi:hypothetical protein